MVFEWLSSNQRNKDKTYRQLINDCKRQFPEIPETQIIHFVIKYMDSISLA